MTSPILEDHADIISKTLADNQDDVVAVFDADLNYVFVNDHACELLKIEKHAVENKNLLELFPSLIASKSHRHLLQALSGDLVLNVISYGTFTREGAKYSSS